MELTSKAADMKDFGKMCTLIANAILREFQNNKNKICAVCYVFTTKGAVIITGEVFEGVVEDVGIDCIVRRTIIENGYSAGQWGLNADEIAVINLMN